MFIKKTKIAKKLDAQLSKSKHTFLFSRSAPLLWTQGTSFLAVLWHATFIFSTVFSTWKYSFQFEVHFEFEVDLKISLKET